MRLSRLKRQLCLFRDTVQKRIFLATHNYEPQKGVFPYTQKHSYVGFLFPRYFSGTKRSISVFGVLVYMKGSGRVQDGGVPLAHSAERPRFLQVAGVITRGGNVVKTRSVHTLRRHAVNAADTMCGNTRGFLRPCSVYQPGF